MTGVKTWRVPIFYATVHFTTDRAKYRALAKRLGEAADAPLEGGRCFTSVNSDGRLVVVCGVFQRRVSTLSHELNHAAFYILQHAGIDARDSDGETFCYLQGALLEEFLPRTF